MMRAFLTVLTAAAAVNVPQLHFAPTPGWFTGVSVSPQRWSWTATVRLKDCAGCVPHKTLATLPPDGIIVFAHVSADRATRPERSWPPTIRRAEISAGIEGVPARFGVFQAVAKTRSGREAITFVYFGRARPTRTQVAEANERLASSWLR